MKKTLQLTEYECDKCGIEPYNQDFKDDLKIFTIFKVEIKIHAYKQFLMCPGSVLTPSTLTPKPSFVGIGFD